MGGRQHAAGAQLLDRLEIEVLEDGSCPPASERRFVTRNNRAAIPKDAVGEAGWRLVEEHEIHSASRNGFEPRRKCPEIDQLERARSHDADGDVNIALRMRRSLRA